MSPRQVLDMVLEAGGRVIADGPGRPRLLTPPHLRPLVTEHRDALRQVVLEHRAELTSPWPDSIPETGDRRVAPLQACALCDTETAAVYGDVPLCLPCASSLYVVARLALRAILRRCFTLNAAGPAALLKDCTEALQLQAALWDTVGPAAASTILQVTARQWHRETGVCPWCSEAGPLHLDEATAA